MIKLSANCPLAGINTPVAQNSNKEQKEILHPSNSSLCFSSLNELSIYNLHERINRDLGSNRDTTLNISFNATQLTETLLPGDILIKYHSENSDGLQLFNPIDFFIRGLQAATSLYVKHSTNFTRNMVHAGIYVGGGEISEAIAEGVLLSSLDSERVKLKQGMTCGYIVVRLKDSDLAEKTAEVAQKVAVKFNQEVPHQYSIPKGIRGLVGNSELNRKGMIRYLKGAAFAAGKAPLMDGAGVKREFYCSYFALWAIQAAESKKVIEKINQKLPENEKITFPNLENSQTSHKTLEAWASQMTDKHFDLLKKEISLALDAKRTSPQTLYNFIEKHPELFTIPMIISPPQTSS